MSKKYKYSAIKIELIKSIEDGILQPGDKLYSQSEIIRHYDTSVTTANRVLNELAFEGYAYRIKGKGTFVAEQKKIVKKLCLVVPYLLNKYNEKNFGFPMTSSVLLQYIEDECVKNGWQLQLYIDKENPKDRTRELSHAIDGTDGVILCQALTPGIGDEVSMLLKRKIPSIMLDTYLDIPEMDIIATDNYQGTYNAIVKLHKQGIKKIIFLGREKEFAGTEMIARYNGYIEGMKDSKLEPQIFRHSTDNKLFEKESAKIITEIFEQSTDRVAVFSDHIAQLQLFCCKMMDSAINIDYSNLTLVTFDNYSIHTAQEVPILQIVQPFEQMARESVRKIIDISEGKSTLEHKLFTPKLNMSKTVSQLFNYQTG